MNFKAELIEQNEQLEQKARVEIEHGYENFIPQDFKLDPIGYFEKEGKNIKQGEAKFDSLGIIREDPTAVKELPEWADLKGNKLKTIGKRINVEKGSVGESGDPFYEYKIMKMVNDLKFPVAKTIAKVQQGDIYMFVMEKIEGVGWYEKETLDLKKNNDLKQKAEEIMSELKKQFDEAGIIRNWKLKDMIFNVDIEKKEIKNIVPTDWERTKIDNKKFNDYKNNTGI